MLERGETTLLFRSCVKSGLFFGRFGSITGTRLISRCVVSNGLSTVTAGLLDRGATDGLFLGGVVSCSGAGVVVFGIVAFGDEIAAGTLPRGPSCRMVVPPPGLADGTEPERLRSSRVTSGESFVRPSGPSAVDPPKSREMRVGCLRILGLGAVDGRAADLAGFAAFPAGTIRGRAECTEERTGGARRVTPESFFQASTAFFLNRARLTSTSSHSFRRRSSFVDRAVPVLFGAGCLFSSFFFPPSLLVAVWGSSCVSDLSVMGSSTPARHPTNTRRQATARDVMVKVIVWSPIQIPGAQ